MLLVPVRVGRSAIHGPGIFAVDPIAAETPVWRFSPPSEVQLDRQLLDEQPPHFHQIMLHDGSIDSRLNRFILRCDDYRSLNHSETPNIRIDRRADPRGIDVAVRDIAVGEELPLTTRPSKAFDLNQHAATACSRAQPRRPTLLRPRGPLRFSGTRRSSWTADKLRDCQCLDRKSVV